MGKEWDLITRLDPGGRPRQRLVGIALVLRDRSGLLCRVLELARDILGA
jgi:hypothetical protein